ncbi:MAG: polyamine aminopropyltransferase [Alphaproteobacteria bacterium]
MTGRWIAETLHADFRTTYRADKVLHEESSEHQHLVLFENATFGRMLVLDGAIQTTEKDEFIYHEMLAHLPILAHGRVRRVLIIGGGDGGMLEEVLKHRAIERVVMVEIDPSVIAFSKRHLRSICGAAFDDPRAQVVIADGARFVAESAERFDLVIVDSTDPIGPGAVLFTEAFYRGCHRVLNPGGVLVTQNGVPFLQAAELVGSLAAFRRIFRDSGCYLATIPTYTGGPMAFGWACDDPELRRVPIETLSARFAAAGVATRYYTPDVHVAAFALPRYVADLIA